MPTPRRSSTSSTRSASATRFANLRDWFKALYEVLLGQSEGPRFGTFVAIYGTAETRALIEARAGREAEAA